MEYCEFDPAPDIQSVVRRIWTLEGHADEMGGEAQPVLPDGHPELVIHLGDAFERLPNASTPGDVDSVAERQPLMLFAGQLTEQLSLRPTGRIAVVGVRFHPFGAAALLRAPLGELTGFTLGVADVAPDLARALHVVRDTTDSPAAAAVLVQRIVRQWMDPSRIDPRIRGAVSSIVRSGGLIAVDHLARQSEMTRRHLERRFVHAVGVSPKRLARITRFQNALRVLQSAEGPAPGTMTAAACGYADQSHFIREFRELSGQSPAQHVLNQGQLTGFFLEGS